LKLDYFGKCLLIKADGEFKVLSIEQRNIGDTELLFMTSYFLEEIGLNEVPPSGLGAMFK